MYVHGAVVIVFLAVSAVIVLTWHLKPEYSPLFSAGSDTVQLGCVKASDFTIEDIADRVHDVAFKYTAPPDVCDETGDVNADLSFKHDSADATYTGTGCQATLTWSWELKAGPCGPSRLNRAQASSLLQCKHLLFIGDSIIRNLALSVATLLAAPEDPPLRVDRHADMVFRKGCNTTITFLWRPFLANVTQAMADLPAAMSQQPPAHVITGVALWDVLHITNTSAYTAEVDTFAQVVAKLLTGPAAAWQMWWATTTAVRPAQLQTNEKRATMTESNLRAYRKLQRSSVQQVLAGSDAFHVLDVHAMTRRAPASASDDGIHFDAAVYNAVAQALLNMLLAGGVDLSRNTCGCQ